MVTSAASLGASVPLAGLIDNQTSDVMTEYSIGSALLLVRV